MIGEEYYPLFDWLRMQSQFINFCSIDILPLYCPDENEIMNPIVFAKNVRQKMAIHMNYLCTPHGMSDHIVMHLLLKHKMPIEFLKYVFLSFLRYFCVVKCKIKTGCI